MPTHTSLRANRLILIALWLVFYCSFTLFSPPLLDDADSVHAEVAREMLTRHDFVTLHANGIRYLEKAPLYYWTMTASMKLFGVNTAASRLPLAFAVLALALLLEAFARRAFASERAGLYAGLITLSSFGIFIFSRINIPDVMVCVFLCLSLYAYWLAEQEETPSRPLCWTFAVGIAFNILTKGLIGVVFPIAIVLLHLLLTRGVRGTLRRLTQFHPVSSLAILLAIAVPWHVLAALANPGHGTPGAIANVSGHWQVPYPTDGNVHGWAWFYFVNEQLYRYLNLRVPHDYDTSPLWLFYGLIAVWLLPWSAFLPSAFARAMPAWQRLRARTLSPVERTNLFLILWAAVPLLFFSLSTRQEYYVLPALPPMILLIASLLADYVPHLSQPHHDERVAAAADAYVRDHLDEAIFEYKRCNTSGGALAISSDAARELLPGYSTPDERTANTFALSPPSGRFADAIWAHMRKVGPTEDRFVAIFLTGSPGSGKTSSLIESGEEDATAIISEGMMDNVGRSIERIQAAIDAGFVCSIRLVFVNDPRISIRRAVARAMKFGRPVAISHMGQLYVDIAKTIASLKDHFQDNVGLIVFDNSADDQEPLHSTLSEALQVTQGYTVSTATEAMLNELDKLRNDGRVSDQLYSQFRDPVGAHAKASAPDPAASRRNGSWSSDASHVGSPGPHAPWSAGARAVSTFLLIAGVIASAIALFFFLQAGTVPATTDLATLLARNPADYALSFGHFLDLTASSMALFKLPLVLTIVWPLGGALAHWILRRRGQPHAATLALAAGSFVLLFASWTALRIFSPTLSSRQLAAAIAPQLRPGDMIAIHGEYEAGSTLGFYLRRDDIHIVEGRSSNLWYGSFFPDAPKIFETRDSIAQKWMGRQRIFLWQDPNDSERPPLQLPGPVYVVADSGGKRILSNQPAR